MVQIDCLKDDDHINVNMKMIVKVDFPRYNRFELYQQQIRDLLAEGAPIDAIGSKVNQAIGNGNIYNRQ